MSSGPPALPPQGLQLQRTALSGLLDILLLPGQETKAYIAKHGSGYTPEWLKQDGVGFMALPNTRAKPMDDARVTRALRLLMDHDECITANAEPWYGKGRHGCVFAGLEAWDFTQDEYAKMLEWKKPKDDAAKEAIALLGAAGYNKDKPLSFELAVRDSPPAAALGQLLQAQWARLSEGVVKTTIRQYDVPGGNYDSSQPLFHLLCRRQRRGLPGAGRVVQQSVRDRRITELHGF